MNNIILIGMPGSGKSSLGVVLAKKIGFGFIDSDLVIRGNVTIQKVLGREPQFTNQKEFDALMESDAPLVL